MRSKFNVNKDISKRIYNDIVFASELEMKYYTDIILPQQIDGNIVYCELQKKYELQPKYMHNGKTIQPINYVADFFIQYKNGEEEVIDTKGIADSVAKIKKKMFHYKFPDVKYYWLGYSKIDGGWLDYEYIQQQRTKRRKEKQKKKENKW